MIYRYIARDPLGRKVEGELEARDEAHLRRELEGRALRLTWFDLLAQGRRPLGAVSVAVKKEAPVDHGYGVEEDAECAAEISTPAESAPPGAAPGPEETTGEMTGETNQKKPGCSTWFWLLLFLIYVISKLMQIFR